MKIPIDLTELSKVTEQGVVVQREQHPDPPCVEHKANKLRL